MDKYSQLLNSGHSVFIEGCAEAFTWPVVWLPATLILLYILLKNSGIKNFLVLVLDLAALYGATYVASTYLCRPIMELLFHETTVYVSAATCVNTACAFGIATLLIMVVRHKALFITFTLLGIITACVEVYKTAHSVTEVTVEAVLGVLCGVVAYRIYMAWLRKKRTRRDWISDKYTKSGYEVSDVFFLSAVLFATIAALPFISFFLAAAAQ